MAKGGKKNGQLTHVDSSGGARMVDVGGKEEVDRCAIAVGAVTMSRHCAEEVAANAIKKGDVLATAQLAGVMAAKRTAELVPMCHPLRIDHIEVDCRLVDESVQITAKVSCRERTGVEMEALTAVSVAALTIFDMCKAVDPAMVIGPIRVEKKLKDGETSFDRSTIRGTR
jgi:cyclic pyranopterin phosphate synthase